MDNPFKWTVGQVIERLVFLAAFITIVLDLFVWRP